MFELVEHTTDIGTYIFIPGVYDKLQAEYNSSNLLYRAFIVSKDLGLITNVTTDNESIYGKDIHTDYYKIIDEKKWLLTRLKYGI